MPDQPSTPPQPKPVPAAAPQRRPWYRLHWSTWIVIAAVLAFFALMNLPGRVNNHGAMIGIPIFYEHGWPFVYIDRSVRPISPKDEKYLEEDRAKTFFPWAKSTYDGSINEGLNDGDPVWLNKNNWSFTGKSYIYQRWLAVDILISLIATVPFATAYEFWSRRRWHYSLRFLLICVFLVAVGMAWWRTGVNNYEREMKAVKALHEKGYVVSLQCEAPTVLQIFMGKNNLRPVTHVDAILQYSLYDESRKATDADLEHIGDLTHLKHLNFHYTSITDKTLERLHGLANLELLSLDNTKISAEGLKTLRDLPNLRSISLKNTFITDDSLSSLMAFPQLGYLYLSGTKVTDEGLRHLSGMSKLKSLQLNGLPITDDGLKHLESMPQLEELEINGTKVTSKGIDKLQRALPNCQINWMMEVPNPDETDQPTSDDQEETAEKSE